MTNKVDLFFPGNLFLVIKHYVVSYMRCMRGNSSASVYTDEIFPSFKAVILHVSFPVKFTDSLFPALKSSDIAS